MRLRKWLWTDSAANASEHNDYCWWRGFEKWSDQAGNVIALHQRAYLSLQTFMFTTICDFQLFMFAVWLYFCSPVQCSADCVSNEYNFVSFFLRLRVYTTHTAESAHICNWHSYRRWHLQISKHNSSCCKREREQISPPLIKLQTRCAKPNLKQNLIQTNLS